VVFDVDGTLVKFTIDFKTVRTEVINALVKKGIPRPVFSINESVFKTVEKAEVYMRNNGWEEKKIYEVKAAAFSIINKHEILAASKTNLLPGVIDVLKSIREMGLKMALFTLTGEAAVNRILQRFDLKDYFKVVVPRERAPILKPHPAHLKEVIRELNVRENEVLVVGDSIYDVKCGKALGCIVVGVASGISTPRKLREAGADYVLNSITELIPIIRGIKSE